MAAPVAAVAGGTSLAVSGPSVALALLVCQAVAAHGVVALPVITVGLGGLQATLPAFVARWLEAAFEHLPEVASGLLGLGTLSLATPLPVIAGFTSGIGAVIISGQLCRLAGLAPLAGAMPLEIWRHVAENLGPAQ